MLPIANSFRSFTRVFRYARAHRSDIYLGCLYSFIKKLLDIAPEILIGVAIDVVVNRENSFLARFGFEDPYAQMLFLAGVTFFIWIFESVAEYALVIKWRSLAQRLQHELRVDAYQHLQNLDMAFFENQSTGGLVAVLNDDINQLERFFNEGMNSLVQILTSTLLIGAVFFVLAPQVAVFAFIPMPIIFILAFYFQKQAAPLYLDVREKAGSIAARLSNNVSGMTTIRSFTAESHEVNQIQAESRAYQFSNLKAIRVSARFNPLIRMGVLFGFLATFVVGGALTLKGQIPVGVYGVLVFLSQRLLWPLRDLAGTVDLFERAMASADRALALLREPIGLEQAQAQMPFSDNLGIEFREVSFNYTDRVPILNKINLCVRAGQTVAVVGPTGSGKSTITKLLLKFYQPTSGTITVGGNEIENMDPRHLRQHIGLVSQDVFLFHGTIFENIVYGKPSTTRSEAMEAARKAFATEFIDKLPLGLDTIVGERGQKLSGGQKQRISLARVILKNPPILILDEATSAVDNETEALIQKSLTDISRGRTTLVIAHRLSTVTHADAIYVLVNGQIVEHGTHEALLVSRGPYAQLWALQVRDTQNSSPELDRTGNITPS